MSYVALEIITNQSMNLILANEQSQTGPYYPEYESNFGIDHSRIVDLVQVFDTTPRIGVWIIGNER